MYREHHQQDTKNDESHHDIQTKYDSGLSPPLDSGTPMPGSWWLPSNNSVFNTDYRATATKRQLYRITKTDTGSGKDCIAIIQTTRPGSNPHSCAVPRTPNHCPRGFLPWGLSDACPIEFRPSSRVQWWWAGIRQPLTAAVSHPSVDQTAETRTKESFGSRKNGYLKWQ